MVKTLIIECQDMKNLGNEQHNAYNKYANANILKVWGVSSETHLLLSYHIMIMFIPYGRCKALRFWDMACVNVGRNAENAK